MSDEQMEQRLRDALTATADTVNPGGDGLMRIQQRIGARRMQQRWLRPVLVLGSVVVVAAVAVGGVALARHGDNAKVSPAQSGPPTSQPVVGADFPAQGFFPFTTAAEENDWEQQYAGGHSPWIADPVGVATSWVPNYLKAKNVDQVIDENVTSTSAEVTLGRDVSEGGLQPVVTVHMVKFGKAWIVTGATSPHDLLKISSPAPGTTVQSPLTVTGPGFGVDEVAKVELRDAETPGLIAEAPTDGFGNGTPQWSATLSFSPPTVDAGVVVAMTMSAADGGVAQIAAQKVAFASETPAVDRAGFYGVQGGVIERFDATGQPQGPVEGSDAYGTVTEVHRLGSTLYFTTRQHDCVVNSLRAIPVDGTSSNSNDTGVASSTPGYQITGFGLSSDGSKLAFFQTGCGSHAGQGQLVINDLNTGKTRAVDFPSLPPAIEGDPVWESDGVHVDAYVRTGMQAYLARYDATKGDSPTPSANACGEYDPATQLTGALATDSHGTLWFAGRTGASMQVLSCRDGMPNVELTVMGNDMPTALSVDPDGRILLTDDSGRVWSGKAGGTAKQLAAGGGVTYATW